MECKNQAGFTLIELLLVVGIISVLFGLTTINLGQPIPAASLSTTADVLMSDLKSQQLLAMSGDEGNGSSAQPHGLYFQNSQYTLFIGSTYSGSDNNNYSVAAGSNVIFSTTLPSNQIIFSKASGEVQSFTNGSNTITITGPNSSQTITVNKFGATTVQ